MGKKSFIEKTTPVVVEPHLPHSAPSILSDREKEVWCRILNSVVPGYISAESHDQLSAYCQKIVNIERITELKAAIEAELEEVDPFDPLPFKQYDRVLKMLREETAQMMALARSLRITNQSLRSGNLTKGAVIENEAPDWEEPDA